MKKASIILILILSTFFCQAQDGIAGDWYGTLVIPGRGELPIVFHILQTAEGYQSTMDSPEQGAKGIPTSTTFKDSRLTISIPSIGAEYKGELTNEGIKGVFLQGQDFPLTLTQTETKRERPQEPLPPYPYHSEDVKFENQQAGITLAGTLTLPQKEGNYPAVILITGSGPQDRNEEIMGHKPFLVIADHLTRQGIAVLRFDDRGVGESTGDFNSSNQMDFAGDVEAAIDYLKTRREIQPARIGLIGHSEGGMIAPMLTAKRKDISFMVLLAAPGIPGKDLGLQQMEDNLEDNKADIKDLGKCLKCVEDLFEIVLTHPAGVPKSLLENSIRTHMEELAGKDMTPEQEKNWGTAMMMTYSSPRLYGILSYDPAPNLEKTKCAVLALNGEKDRQVRATSNLPAIEKSLTKGGNRSFKIVQLKGLNHFFQECETGSLTEYGKIPQTFSPEALNIISGWIKEQTGKRKKSENKK